MTPRWEEIELLEDPKAERTLCDCCRGTTTRIVGDLQTAEDYLGWYQVFFSDETGFAHPPVLWIYTGDWRDGAAPGTRWGIQVQWHLEGCALLDFSSEQRQSISHYTPLDREDVLGSPFETDLWAMVDAIIMKDSRLEAFHT